MEVKVVGYIAGAVLILVILAYWRGWGPFKRLTGTASTPAKYRQQQMIDSLIVIEARPGLPKVKSRAPVKDEVWLGIGDGFMNRITAARAKGWASGLDPELYTLNIFPSVRDTDANGTYSPVFQVFLDKNDPYVNSEYNHGTPDNPWIYAAEQVLTTGNVPKNEFIIADNASREYSMVAVSNALDHLFLWHNDRSLYQSTLDHSKGGGHPLW